MSSNQPAGRSVPVPSVDLAHGSPVVPVINLSNQFRLGVDLLEAFENADPNWPTRRQTHGEPRLDESLDAFLRGLNPTRLDLTNDLPRNGWLELIDRAGLDRDIRSVAKALAFLAADINGGMDSYPRWWNRRLAGEIELEEFIAWADIRCRLCLALAGVWSVMSDDDRKRVPAVAVNRLLAVAGWGEIPTLRPRPVRGFGGRLMGERWRTLRLPPDAATGSEWEAFAAAEGVVGRSGKPCSAAEAPKRASDKGEDSDTGGARKSKGKDINGRMLKMLQDNFDVVVEWTSRQWAMALGCDAGTVRDTKTWKEDMKQAREKLRRDRVKRPPKGKRGG